MHTEAGHERRRRRGEVIRLLILVGLTLCIGVYLIGTTIIVSRDGVRYIEHAQEFSTDAAGAVTGKPFGYPLLIFLTHEVYSFFGDESSALGWVYSGQIVSLVSRILSVVALYFLGGVLVGGRRSFWALLVLLILPYLARMGCDVLRDWPHVLFLAAGFLFLVLGSKRGKWWMFAVAGLAAGLGHMIRAECAQLVVYGGFWVLASWFSTRRSMSRGRLAAALLVLLVGFSVAVVPYRIVKAELLPPKLQQLIESLHQRGDSQAGTETTDGTGSDEQSAEVSSHGESESGDKQASIAEAFGNLSDKIARSLMYFFVLPVVIGLWERFRKGSEADGVEKLYVGSAVVLNLVLLILLYCNYGYISRRHCLPLIVYLIFCVPVGLEVLGRWLDGAFSKWRSPSEIGARRCFFILLGVGIAFCAPTLFRPMGFDKTGYASATKWFRSNTAEDVVIAEPWKPRYGHEENMRDMRISFYAERGTTAYVNTKGNIPPEADYVVKVIEAGEPEPHFDRAVKEEVRFPMNKRQKKELIIYRVVE